MGRKTCLIGLLVIGALMFCFLMMEKYETPSKDAFEKSLVWNVRNKVQRS